MSRAVPPEVVRLDPPRHRDERGWFQALLTPAAGEDLLGWRPFVQVNRSSSGPGVLRGLHLQRRRPQGKLIQVLRGAIFDVAVDLRPGSPRFGAWVGLWLRAERGGALWVPPGFAHGFYSPGGAELIYLVTEPWDPGGELCLAWDDPAVGVRWPLAGRPLLSERDAAGLDLARARALLEGA